MAEVKSIETPVGELRYCFITGKGRLKPRSKGEYSYSCAIILDKKEGKALNAEINEFFNENKPAKCKLDEPENKIYEKLEDGRWMFQFRTNTVFIDKKTKEERPNKVKTLNNKNIEQDLPQGTTIGNGTTGRIIGALQVYEGDTPADAGCSMYLNAVQIGKFVPYLGGVSASGEIEGDDNWGTPEFPNSDLEKPKKRRDDDDDDEDEEEEPVKVKKEKKDKKKKKKKKSSDEDE